MGTYHFSGPAARTFTVTQGQGTLSAYIDLARRSLTLWPLGEDRFFDPSTGGTLVFQRENGVVKTLRAGLAATAPVGIRK